MLSDTVTQCAYKGTAIHWSARVGAAVHPDIARRGPGEVS